MPAWTGGLYTGPGQEHRDVRNDKKAANLAAAALCWKEWNFQSVYIFSKSTPFSDFLNSTPGMKRSGEHVLCENIPKIEKMAQICIIDS